MRDFSACYKKVVFFHWLFFGPSHETFLEAWREFYNCWNGFLCFHIPPVSQYHILFPPTYSRIRWTMLISPLWLKQSVASSQTLISTTQKEDVFNFVEVQLVSAIFIASRSINHFSPMGPRLPEAQGSSYSGTSKYQFPTDVQLEHLFVSSLPITMFILLIVGKTWLAIAFFGFVLTRGA